MQRRPGCGWIGFKRATSEGPFWVASSGVGHATAGPGVISRWAWSAGGAELGGLVTAGEPVEVRAVKADVAAASAGRAGARSGETSITECAHHCLGRAVAEVRGGVARAEP